MSVIKQWLLPPGETNPFVSALGGYPGYSSSKGKDDEAKMSRWRRLKATLDEDVAQADLPNDRDLINEWVQKLIRRELREALADDAKLEKIEVGPEAAQAIHDALKRRLKGQAAS
jgi:hypothetical protein